MDEAHLRWLGEEIGRLRQNLDWVRPDLRPAPATPPEERRAREAALARVAAAAAALDDLVAALAAVRPDPPPPGVDIVRRVRPYRPRGRRRE